MASRFNQRDPNTTARNALFSGYNTSTTRSRPSSASPNPSSSRQYSSHSPYVSDDPPPNAGFGAYPSSGGGLAPAMYGGSDSSFMGGGGREAYKSAEVDSKGRYSDAVLSGLESQNDEQVSEMGRKVAMLKDITMKIGDEIRDSTAFAEKMNDQFSNSSAKLKGTMNRMLRMAERTGVGWKVWLGFFAFVILLFWYVKLF